MWPSRSLTNIQINGPYPAWIRDASIVVVGSIRGAEYNYPIDVHELARIFLTRVCRIRGQSNFVWAGCQAICEILQGNQALGLVQTIAQLTNNVCKK